MKSFPLVIPKRQVAHGDLRGRSRKRQLMASSTPRRENASRMLSPVPSPIDVSDVLKYINQRHLHRESVYIDCSDPGVHEDREMYGPHDPTTPTRRYQSMAVIPTRPTHAKSATATYRTPSMNMRTNSEVRDDTSSSAIAVPLIPNRRRQYQTAASQNVFARRPMPETIHESQPTSIRFRREQNISANDMAAGSTADGAAQSAESADPLTRKSVPPAPNSNETLIQTFDRIMRLELDRIKETDCEELGSFVDRDAAAAAAECELPGIREAVAQFARAQGACEFDAAVRAADAAASEAPPEMAEEAAVTGAREYRTEIVDEVHDFVPGDRIVEVVGYVGITRPVN